MTLVNAKDKRSLSTLALALTAAGAAVGGGYFVASNSTRTSPGITVSNVLTKAKDGRVIKSTVVPKSTWRGGQTWIVTTTRSASRVDTTIARIPTMQSWVYVDSIFEAFPQCVPYRVTVVPDTVLSSGGRINARRDSLTTKLALCRPYTVAEAAFADTFPVGRLAPCVAQPTAAMLQARASDFPKGDTLVFAVFYRNRYTRQVMADGPMPQCEPMRALWESLP